MLAEAQSAPQNWEPRSYTKLEEKFARNGCHDESGLRTIELLGGLSGAKK